ncbi:hypothetical protein BOX17_06470 [Halomonas aestuarii]|uniref:Uncharacterized protein n=1 Tax=Halomonas aestuarii TaxID=1897729 RepID=A0A1J0VF20_9GAMM|nr:hypothetical protein BOX17_06470 [Halomonas aestuarii]
MNLLLAGTRRQYRHAPAETANDTDMMGRGRPTAARRPDAGGLATFKNTVHKMGKLGFTSGQESLTSVTMNL